MKIIKKLIFLIVLAASGYGGWIYYINNSSEVVAYRTEKITRGNISATVSATGTLNPVVLVTVGSQVSGKINKLYVKVNDHVEEGQLLAEVDPALLLAQLKQDTSALENARIAFEQTERDLNRTKMLLAKDFVAKVELERAEQTYRQAKNGYDSAKTIIERDNVNLNYAKITSPIDGVVIGQSITEGQTIQTSQSVPDLFRIAGNLNEMKIEVNFSESDINKIKVAMPVTFTVNAYPERTFRGKVKTVNLNPSGQSTAGVTYGVVIEVKNEDGVLLPGMTGYVSVILSEQKDVLRMPLSALRFNPPKEQTGNAISRMFGVQAANTNTNTPRDTNKVKTVYLLREGTLAPVQVTMGASDEAYTEVSGDAIAEGSEVVVGLQKSKK